MIWCSPSHSDSFIANTHPNVYRRIINTPSDLLCINIFAIIRMSPCYGCALYVVILRESLCALLSPLLSVYVCAIRGHLIAPKLFPRWHRTRIRINPTWQNGPVVLPQMVIFVRYLMRSHANQTHTHTPHVVLGWVYVLIESKRTGALYTIDILFVTGRALCGARCPSQMRSCGTIEKVNARVYLREHNAPSRPPVMMMGPLVRFVWLIRINPRQTQEIEVIQIICGQPLMSSRFVSGNHNKSVNTRTEMIFVLCRWMGAEHTSQAGQVWERSSPCHSRKM